MDDLSSRELGEYRLIEKLGQGQTATVYRAYQASLNRPVAVKVLDPAFTSKIGFVSRFKREARLVARLRHPHILPLYDYGEQKGLIYLVTDYVEGSTLRTRMQGEPMEWHQAASLLLPIARALAYVHSQGVTHRDVKPSNVLIGRNDWPLLSDFGIAKEARADMPATMSGEATGLPYYYMSPEQAQTIQVDERSDIYSLGVVLYELVTGRLPFRGDSPLEVMRQHLNETAESPCAINPSLPAMGEAIILRAMTKNPGGRYQLMGEMVNALQVALTQTSLGSVDPTYTPMIARHETCPRCGAPVNMLGRYCTKCGAKLRPGSGFLSRAQPETKVEKPPARAGVFRFVLESGSEIYFPPKVELIIGRADKNSELFPDIDLSPHDGATLGVSRVHAQLRQYGDAWVVEDQGSTNGTFVNGRRVGRGEEVALRLGDRLRCGRLVLTFQM